MNKIILYILLSGSMSACTTTGQQETALTRETESLTHDELMNEMMTTPKLELKTLGILVYDGVNDLDFMGPKYVLGQLRGIKTQLIALDTGNITTVTGTEIVPNTVIDSVHQLDILVIPGGFKGTVEATYDKKLHAWIRAIDEHSAITASVCSGGWILAATGLLEGKQATTNWFRAKEKLEAYGATFVDARYTQDGKYWSSAGVTAGMDMSLAIMNDIWGENYTQGVMLDMEYNPAPPIEGGSPEKTKPEVYQMMETMYAMALQPLIDSLECKR